MADNEVVFDATLKKKKKKKVSADPDAADAGADAGGDNPELDMGDMPKKKKKKKKVVLDDGPEDAGDDAGGELGDLPAKKKKKKKKKVADLADGLDDLDAGGVDALSAAAGEMNINENNNDEGGADAGAASGSSAGPAALPWAGSDRDYTYAELTSRIFSILEANNPELGDKTKVRMKPPQVVSSGAKRTAFVNFTDICKTMHRNPDHVKDFILAELGTSASTDANQRLLLKGRFQSKSIEGILKRYITEYVVCHGCKSPHTTLVRENKIFFVSCDVCGAKRSVSTISKGFQAQIGRRRDRRK